MMTFLSSIHVHNTIAEYEIFQKGQKYKALLHEGKAGAQLPLALSLWKESGQWRASQLVSEHVLYQFGYIIDNHLLSHAIDDLKRCAA